MQELRGGWGPHAHGPETSRGAACLIALTVIFTACGSPTEPEPVEVTVPLSSITLDIFEQLPLRWLEIRGEVADGSRPLEAHERVRVSVTTSGGDHEDLLVGPEICEEPNNGLYFCRWLGVSMKAGRDVRTVRQPVEHLGAWLFVSGVCDRFTGECVEFPSRGRVYVPGDRGIHQVRHALAWVPGVQSVVPSGVFYAASVSATPVAGGGVYARVPLVSGPVLQGDGIAQVTDDDLVRVTTPDGGMQASLGVIAAGARS